ncbi:prepilin-type N-terminal cleavage/methylation domain-containing protein [Lysinibacillus fusiformis]|uniref:prepilin-type N-terminal cleavage/methylation domain-containing protein n=1 Tax=Lysinibacillus fusiformis TaxID=28031 RepID=UPI0019684DEB|nr:prepilin-type N-terminal cleavage/methylation domain-containing protein [Lysinibacillus fusiformis]QSB08375.1 prepilin-type N-terminal cleavage/methylation domain-containing protein [Lysinibacillus fusiformis]
MGNRLKNEKGLTLVELLAVIVILAIVAAIAVPAIGNVIDNSRYKALKADAINVIHAAQFYFMEHPSADPWQEVKVRKLVSEGYLDSAGKILEADKENQYANVQFMNGVYYFSAHAIYYSSGKYINFDNATLQHIADDIRKGSKGTGGKCIGRDCAASP